MRTVLTTTAALMLAACGGVEQDEETGEAFVAERVGEEAETEAVVVTEPAPAPAPAPTDEVTLTALDCGTIEVGDLGVFSVGGEYDGQTDTFADTCWLVEHPDGVLLWDLGLPAGLVEAGPVTNGPFTVSLERTLADQLSQRGVAPDYVAISHSHFDHTGQPEAAVGATFVATDAEATFMEENPASQPGATPYDALLEMPREAFSGERDVFGDGRVRIVEMPGHTPGHAVLLVELAEEGPVLLTGDMYHLDRARELRTVPTFNTSEEATRESMGAFEALAEETGARVIIQHEGADVDRLIGETLR